jgi:hypothetical protein
MYRLPLELNCEFRIACHGYASLLKLQSARMAPIDFLNWTLSPSSDTLTMSFQ